MASTRGSAQRTAGVALLSTLVAAACGARSLYISPDPAPAAWHDEIVAIQVRVQANLLVVATILNRSPAHAIVPAPILSDGSPLNSYELLDAADRQVRTVAAHADWFLEDRPMVELKPGELYSEAVDLRTMFPALKPGTYRLRFALVPFAGDRSTWRGRAQVPDVAFTVVN